MKKINNDFNIPYYIFEEIIEYIELKKDSKNKVSKWDNILLLLNIAVANKKITLEQSEYIKKTFCRE